MQHDLPPLAAIRVFEAAARLSSFTRAAEELGMTQAAVSYQIKVLEERVGAPLFLRQSRQVVLTDTGERLALRATGALSTLADAWVHARDSSGGVLKLTSTNTFISNWLGIRVGTFQMAHPHLIIKLDSNQRYIDLQREDMDVAIRAGSGNWPGLTSHYLFKADYGPMISPRLVERVGPMRVPSDLYKVTFLGPDNAWWPNWFECAGETFQPELVKRGPTFGPLFGTQAYQALAAVSGQGTAVLIYQLYKTLIDEGQLVMPFDILGYDGSKDFGYWLVYPDNRRNQPKVRAFREWILDETRAMREIESP